MTMTSNSPAFGVYIHWPFCAAKCPYCDFNSHVRHKPVDQTLFRQAYEREIEHLKSIVPDRTVSSIFFGGGTPSLMDVETVAEILDTLSQHWALASDVEITMEANPQSVDATRFAGYRQAGVNRMSLGVQSFDDAVLKFLGRLHNALEARNAIETARSTFDRISFDLIYARPGQTVEQWESELLQAVDLAADHLSLYQLTIEPETPFFDLHEAGKLNPLPEENAAQLYEATQEITGKHGLPAYEISNHAKPGSECRHNLVYWRGGEYAGIGPGAHGRLDTPNGRLATSTIKSPEDWWQQVMHIGHGIDVQETLSTQERADEFLLFGLRLTEGIDLARYEQIAGEPLAGKQIEFLVRIGMLEQIGNAHIRVTPAGQLVLDAVVADLAATTD